MHSILLYFIQSLEHFQTSHAMNNLVYLNLFSPHIILHTHNTCTKRSNESKATASNDSIELS